MGRSCGVETCVHYKKEHPNVSIFSVPKDELLFGMWCTVASCVGITLNKNSWLCQNHFKKEDIHDKVIKTDKTGKIIFYRELEKKSLEPGAVPCYFNSVEGPVVSLFLGGTLAEGDCQERCNTPNGLISDSLGTNPLTTGTDSIDISQEEQEGESFSTVSFETIVSATDTESIDIPQEKQASERFSTDNTEIVQETQVQNFEDEHIRNVRREIFSSLFNRPALLKLPNPSWGISISQQLRYIILQEVLDASINESMESPPLNKKQIVIDSNLNIKVYFLNKHFATRNNFNNLEEIEKFIFRIHEMSLCIGGPKCREYRDITTRAGFKDFSGRWRHNSCSFRIENGTVCLKCYSLHETLYRRARLKATQQ